MATKTKVGILAETLASLNPWWRTATWEGDDPDLRSARQSGLAYSSDVLANLQSGGLYVLRGPRRVGKTVAAKQAIARLIHEGVPALSIVRFAADGTAASDLRSIVQRVTLPAPPPGQQRFWFIDEVTGATGEWPATVKWLRDNDPSFSEATVVITGSDAEALTGAIGLWAGRRGEATQRDRVLLPMGFRTFVRLVWPGVPETPRLPLADLRTSGARDAFAGLQPWLADLRRCWDLYLGYGGYPISVAAAKRGERTPGWFLDDIFTVIFKDVFRESRASVTATTDIVARLMEGMGSPANLTTIAMDTDMAPTTVTRHLSYLRNGYLAWVCPQRSPRQWMALAGAQSKVYAVDPLVARLSHLKNPARDDLDPTLLNEMMLGMAIRRAMVAAGQEWEGDDQLFYWRTPTRKEIDFVSSALGGSAIEAKFVDDGRWKGEARTVEASEWRGVVATRSVLDTSEQDGAWAVPSGVLAYLLDT